MRKRWMLSGLLAAWIAISPSGARAQVRLAAQSAVAMSEDQTAVVATMRAMYSAATANDLALFDAQLAPGFYAFDGGQRFDGDALMHMVMDYHAKGVSFVWTVTKPDVHVFGDHAWIAYTNAGSITMSPGATPTPLTWLESASLVKIGGAWKIAFFHSTRVPAPEPAK